MATDTYREPLQLRWLYLGVLAPLTLLYLSGVEVAFPMGVWSWLTSLSRLAGLWASGLLLLQLAFMGRIPLIESHLSRDGIVRVHRTAGFWSFWLMLLHIALVTLAYSEGFPTWWDSTYRLVLREPGLLIGTLGSLLLVLVVATSIRSAMARLRYESWHLLHLYAYVGVYLALPHQLWTGQDFLGHPRTTALWWGMWGLVAGLVLYYRLLTPLFRSAYHHLRVVSVEPLGDNLYHMVLTGRRLTALRVRAGQAVTLRFLTRGGFTRANPFSLASLGEDRWEVLFAVVGEGTARMASLSPGTRVFFEGPYGNLYSPHRAHSSYVLVGAGTGLAPLLAITEALPEEGEAILVARTRTRADPLLQHLRRSLRPKAKARLLVLAGSRSASTPWLPEGMAEEDFFERMPLELSSTIFVLCGPQSWLDSLRRSLVARGARPSNIRLEAFGW